MIDSIEVVIQQKMIYQKETKNKYVYSAEDCNENPSIPTVYITKKSLPTKPEEIVIMVKV